MYFCMSPMRNFRRKFCDERAPSKQTIHNLVNKLKQRDS
jgi:hypothetical protein